MMEFLSSTRKLVEIVAFLIRKVSKRKFEGDLLETFMSSFNKIAVMKGENTDNNVDEDSENNHKWIR